jgi:hypothetical protein
LSIAYLEKAVRDGYAVQAVIGMAVCVFCQILHAETVGSLRSHLYAIPCFKADGFGLKFGVGQRVKKGRVVLNEVARRIRNALQE